MLCNDRCSKGFAQRQGRRRASGHASVYGCFLKEFLRFPRGGEPGSRGRFSFRLQISISTSPLYLAVTSRSAHASSLRRLLEEFIFPRDQRSILPAWFALGNLNIISTSSSYDVGDGFFAVKCDIFRAPPGCPGVERQFFGALDGEEFFAIEGSCTVNFSDVWIYTC